MKPSRNRTLSVPGHIEKMHVKASQGDVDVIMLDLEDSVPVEAKVSARARLITLVFGIVDYSASIGSRLVLISGHGKKEEEIYPGHRWNFEMSRIVMAAKAHGLLAIDAP